MTDQSPVYVVDDDADLRQSLQWMLSHEGFEVHSYPSGERFLNAYEPNEGGCLVLDVRMPEMGGLELQRRLRQRGRLLPIIMMTAHSDVVTAVTAIKEGSLDFIEKPFRHDELISKIRGALEIDHLDRERRCRFATVAERIGRLTPRERQVMDLLVEGKISKQIALELGCSVRTIESHRARVMHKMGVDTIAQLVRAALEARELVA